MKHQGFLLGILLTQAALPKSAAKPLTLYRIDGNSITNEATNSRTFMNSDGGANRVVTGISNEFYDDAKVPSQQAQYKDEEDKLLKERRDLFTRNLASMSMSLSFNVIIAPPPVFTVTGQDESSYDVLREKLLGSGASDEDDQDAIDKANELASVGTVSGLVGAESEFVETVLDVEPIDPGYVSLREKLLGKQNDEEFEEEIDEDIDKANEQAKDKSPFTGKEKRNLRRR